MPIDIIPKALYPLVPQLPGVPALLRGGAAILDTLTFGAIGFGDILDGLIGAETDKWGVFDEGGNKIADYDSVYTLDFKNDARISDFPVEEGGFTSYNKVASPYDSIVVLTCGGSESRRATCLSSLKLAQTTLDLYSIFTPTDSITDANLIGLSYSSTAQEGAGMLTAHLTFREVRKTATATLVEPKSPSAFAGQSQGQIQTVDDPAIDVSGFA